MWNDVTSVFLKDERHLNLLSTRMAEPVHCLTNIWKCDTDGEFVLRREISLHEDKRRLQRCATMCTLVTSGQVTSIWNVWRTVAAAGINTPRNAGETGVVNPRPRICGVPACCPWSRSRYKTAPRLRGRGKHR